MYNELTENEKRLYNNLGTEICGYSVDEVVRVFTAIVIQMIEDGKNGFK